MGKSSGQNTCLAGARASQYEQRPLGRNDRLALLRVESAEIIRALGRDEGLRHARSIECNTDMAKPSFSSPSNVTRCEFGPQGHRERMRQRVLQYGCEGLADYEIVEMLLFFAIPRRDTKPFAKKILTQFGSLSGLSDADEGDLRAAGLNEKAIRLLKLPKIVAGKLRLKEERVRPSIGTWRELCAYMETSTNHGAPDEFRLLYLDNRNRLLADEPVEDFMSTAPIFRRALTLQAIALIGVQRTLISESDASISLKAFANRLREEASSLSIVLHDVIVVSRRRPPISLKQKGFF